MGDFYKKFLRWWNRSPRFLEGEVLTFYPARDLCRSVLIVDVARLEEGIVGIRVRTYGMLRRTSPLPEFGEILYIEVAKLNEVGWTYDRADPMGTKQR